MIPRFHRLLPLLHTKLFVYSQTALGPHKENHPLALGRMTIQSIRRVENSNVLKSGSGPTKL